MQNSDAPGPRRAVVRDSDARARAGSERAWGISVSHSAFRIKTKEPADGCRWVLPHMLPNGAVN